MTKSILYQSKKVTIFATCQLVKDSMTTLLRLKWRGNMLAITYKDPSDQVNYLIMLADGFFTLCFFHQKTFFFFFFFFLRNRQKTFCKDSFSHFPIFGSTKKKKILLMENYLWSMENPNKNKAYFLQFVFLFFFFLLGIQSLSHALHLL